MATVERFWCTYCAAMVVVAVGCASALEPWRQLVPFVTLHAALAAVQAVPAVAARRGRARTARWLRAGIAVVGLPTVFSALALVLPAVHAAPWEIAWYRLEIALFGGDSTAELRRTLPAWAVLPLQVAYALFYLVPIAAALLVRRARGDAAFDRAVALLVGGFLVSYLGYLWWPTLAPRVVLPAGAHGGADGGALAAAIGRSIDAAEANPFDCFPSGHTMLSVTSALLVRRWAPRALPWLLLVVVPLIASTMCLRYHWPIDVVAGAAFAWPVLRACDWLLDRDGMPAA